MKKSETQSSPKKLPQKLSSQVNLIGEKVEHDQQTISQIVKESEQQSNSLAE